MSAPAPNASLADKIKWSLEGIERPSKYINVDDTNEIEKDVSKVELEEKKELSFEDKLHKAFFYVGGPEVLEKKKSEKNETEKEQDAVRKAVELMVVGSAC